MLKPAYLGLVQFNVGNGIKQTATLKISPQNVECKLVCLARYLATESIRVNGPAQSPRIPEK